MIKGRRALAMSYADSQLTKLETIKIPYRPLCEKERWWCGKKVSLLKKVGAPFGAPQRFTRQNDKPDSVQSKNRISVFQCDRHFSRILIAQDLKRSDPEAHADRI